MTSVRAKGPKEKELGGKEEVLGGAGDLECMGEGKSGYKGGVVDPGNSEGGSREYKQSKARDRLCNGSDNGELGCLQEKAKQGGTLTTNGGGEAKKQKI